MRLANLAFRSIVSKKLRSFLTVMGIAIGVSLIFAVAITNQAIVGSFVNVVQDLSGASDLQVNDVSAGYFDQSVISKASATPGVAEAAPIVSRHVIISANGKSDNIRLTGVDIDKEKRFRNYRFAKGRFLPRSGRSILLVKSWADKRGLSLNDSVYLQGKVERVKFKIVGLLKKVGPGAADNGAVAIIELSRAQDLFGIPKKLTQIDVKVAPDVKVASVKRRLRKNIPVGYDVKRPEEKGASIEAVTKGMMSAFSSFGSLALFIGAFVVFNTMMMSVAERRREMGLLRLVGADRRQILEVILLESVVFGILGSVIGLFLGKLLATSLAQQVAAVYHISLTKVTTPFGWAVASGAIGIVVSVFAGLQPAWRASVVTPIEAVRGDRGVGRNRLARYGWLPGLILIAIGIAVYLSPLKERNGALAFDIGSALIFLGMALFSLLLVRILTYILAPLVKAIFGNEGRLAVDSIKRELPRAALAVVTLMVSLSMIIASGELGMADRAFLNNWIEAAMPFDVSVRTPLPLSIVDINKYTPVDVGLRKKLIKVKGVEEVAPVKFILAKGLKRDLFVISIAAKSWRRTTDVKFEEGDKKKTLDTFDRGGKVMISSTITSKNGLHAGDKLRLKTPSGWRYFKVGGVFPTVANDGYVVYISRHDQIKYWHDLSTDGFNVTLKARAGLESTIKRIKKVVVGQSGVEVLSGRDIRQEVRNSVNGFLSVVNALVWLALAVTVLGIINTLAMSVAERIREIGVLRAIGSSRLQIGKMIFAEAGVLGLMGAILGIVSGLLVAWQLVVISQLVGGWKVPFIFPTLYLWLAVIMSVGVSLLSSLLPAREAARVDIVKAVQWE